jgi:uncharacterized protein YkwD
VRRTRYLLCGLLAVPALIAGTLYLARGPAPSAPPSASSAASSSAASSSAASSASSVPPATANAVSAADPCAPAVASCAASPIHVAIARVPASALARRPASRPAPSPASSRPATGPAGTPPASTPADEVLAVINQARSAAGLPPLTVTSGLVTSASAHTMTMAGGCGLSHQCPGEPSLGARETAAGVHWTAAGENIGEGGPVADTTAAIAQMAVGLTQDMLNETPPDDGHRLNILGTAYTHIGIAVFRDSSGTVWLTQDFSN